MTSTCDPSQSIAWTYHSLFPFSKIRLLFFFYKEVCYFLASGLFMHLSLKYPFPPHLTHLLQPCLPAQYQEHIFSLFRLFLSGQAISDSLDLSPASLVWVEMAQPSCHTESSWEAEKYALLTSYSLSPSLQKRLNWIELNPSLWIKNIKVLYFYIATYLAKYPLYSLSHIQGRPSENVSSLAVWAEMI